MRVYLRILSPCLELKGVGPKTIRALALISELVYGKSPSFNDPVRYSFAHGGKDGHPYPVDKETYDGSIEILRKALKQSKLEIVKRWMLLSDWGIDLCLIVLSSGMVFLTRHP